METGDVRAHGWHRGHCTGAFMKERDRDPVSQLPCDKRAFHRL